MINPIKYPDIYQKLGVIPANGLLLYGPPGTGKTMFGRAIANEMNSEFVAVGLSDVRGKTSLQTVEMISNLFSKARNCVNGCVLFLDDCEELLSRPGNSKAYGVSQFLNELDGFRKTNEAGGVFVLIATNRPWMIDSALLRSGRIGAAIHVGLPGAEARKQILMDALNDVSLGADVDIDKLVERTEGYSGAELFHRTNGGGICNEAKKFAALRWIRRRQGLDETSAEYAKVEPVTWDDFERALKTVIPTSVRDAEIIAKNKSFKENSGIRR